MHYLGSPWTNSRHQNILRRKESFSPVSVFEVAQVTLYLLNRWGFQCYFIHNMESHNENGPYRVGTVKALVSLFTKWVLPVRLETTHITLLEGLQHTNGVTNQFITHAKLETYNHNINRDVIICKVHTTWNTHGKLSGSVLSGRNYGGSR